MCKLSHLFMLLLLHGMHFKSSILLIPSNLCPFFIAGVARLDLYMFPSLKSLKCSVYTRQKQKNDIFLIDFYYLFIYETIK